MHTSNSHSKAIRYMSQTRYNIDTWGMDRSDVTSILSPIGQGRPTVHFGLAIYLPLSTKLSERFGKLEPVAGTFAFRDTQIDSIENKRKRRYRS